MYIYSLDFGKCCKSRPDTEADQSAKQHSGLQSEILPDSVKDIEAHLNLKKELKIKTIYKDLDMEENMTSQQAFDEAILLLTNPFCKADIIDSTPELNMADSQICSNNITQSTQSIFPEDENANDG
uniref:Uncharacterized protein n=1 Tax=Romanomermis culicivorax TaxID=13658 RepID=A0A915LC99_ROMCU